MSTKPAAPVSVPDAITRLPHPWESRDLAFANGSVLQVVRFERVRPLAPAQPGRAVPMLGRLLPGGVRGGRLGGTAAGASWLMPKGVRHRPVADEPAYGLMIERPETKQYGNP